MARRPARLEGDVADPVPGDNGAALARIADYFRNTFPDDWEALRLCPLQHGLEAMADKLK